MARPMRIVRRMSLVVVVAAGLAVAAIPVAASGQCDPVQSAKLIASDTFGDDQFGSSAAIDGDTLIVGAPRHRLSGMAEAGAAYVFVRGPSGWLQEAKLISPDPGVGEWFGWSVAIDGETAVVGSMGDDHSDKQGAGAAYVFTRDGGVWTLRSKLIAPDPEAYDYLGCSVSISGSTIVAGAFQSGWSNEGAAYIFEGAGALWTMRAKLIETSGMWVEWFGTSVAVDGDTLAVGCTWRRDGAEVIDGAACVYTRGAGGWVLEETLTASDGVAYDDFGWSIDVSGDTVIVGARYDDTVRGTDMGSAYVFRRTGGGWIEEAHFIDMEGTSRPNFGWSVGLDGDVAVVGAPRQWRGGTSTTGAGHVYSRSGGVWTAGPRMYAADGQPQDEMGYSAAVSGDTAVLGAWLDTHVPYVGDSGSAYVFELGCVCPADLTGDGLVDFSDYLEFLNLYEAGDPSVDFNGDGIVDFSDYLEFLNFYDAGC